MQKQNKLILLTISGLLLTTTALAQDTTQPGQPPQNPPGRFQEFRQERREDIKELRGEAKEMRQEFREGVKDLKAWKQASTTATGTRPTPYKDMRKDMMEERKEYREDRREDRQDFREEMGMKPKMLNATATAAIAAKLGMTPETLQAQLASGTKLKELVKDRISPEEMKNILPPRVATFTRAIQEKGFFNNFRARVFGERKEIVEQKVDEFGEEVVTTTPDTSERPFWKRFFGF